MSLRFETTANFEQNSKRVGGRSARRCMPLLPPALYPTSVCDPRTLEAPKPQFLEVLRVNTQHKGLNNSKTLLI